MKALKLCLEAYKHFLKVHKSSIFFVLGTWILAAASKKFMTVEYSVFAELITLYVTLFFVTMALAQNYFIKNIKFLERLSVNFSDLGIGLGLFSSTITLLVCILYGIYSYFVFSTHMYINYLEYLAFALMIFFNGFTLTAFSLKKGADVSLVKVMTRTTVFLVVMFSLFYFHSVAPLIACYTAVFFSFVSAAFILGKDRMISRNGLKRFVVEGIIICGVFIFVSFLVMMWLCRSGSAREEFLLGIRQVGRYAPEISDKRFTQLAYTTNKDPYFEEIQELKRKYAANKIQKNAFSEEALKSFTLPDLRFLLQEAMNAGSAEAIKAALVRIYQLCSDPLVSDWVGVPLCLIDGQDVRVARYDLRSQKSDMTYIEFLKSPNPFFQLFAVSEGLKSLIQNDFDVFIQLWDELHPFTKERAQLELTRRCQTSQIGIASVSKEKIAEVVESCKWQDSTEEEFRFFAISGRKANP